MNSAKDERYADVGITCITPTSGLCRPGGGRCWWRPHERREGRHNPALLIDTLLSGFPERRVMMGDPSRARVTGPLQQYAPGFAAELARLGYTSESAYGPMLVMAL